MLNYWRLPSSKLTLIIIDMEDPRHVILPSHGIRKVTAQAKNIMRALLFENKNHQKPISNWNIVDYIDYF